MCGDCDEVDRCDQGSKQPSGTKYGHNVSTTITNRALEAMLNIQRAMTSPLGLDAEPASESWQAVLSRVLQAIVDSAVNVFEAGSASIHVLYDAERGQFGFQACAGKIGKEFFSSFPPRAQGIGQRALRARELQLVDDPELLAETHPTMYKPMTLWAKYPEKYKIGEGVRCICCVPVAMACDWEGLLYLHHWQGHHWTEEELHLLNVIAEQASMTIQQIHLQHKMHTKLV